MSFVPREQSKLHTLPYACVSVVQNLAPPIGVPGSGHVVAEAKQVLNYLNDTYCVCQMSTFEIQEIKSYSWVSSLLTCWVESKYLMRLLKTSQTFLMTLDIFVYRYNSKDFI